MAMIRLLKIRYTPQRTKPLTITIMMEFPTLFLAVSGCFLPRFRLTNAQHPSPIMTAMASAITVSGNTTVFAAFPYEPRYDALAIKIWSTIL